MKHPNTRSKRCLLKPSRSVQVFRMKVILGAMSFGLKEVAPHSRVTDVETANAILDVFQRHGYVRSSHIELRSLHVLLADGIRHNEIETARRYGNGSSETLLGQLKLQERGLKVNTKYLPALNTFLIGSDPSDSLASIFQSLIQVKIGEGGDQSLFDSVGINMPAWKVAQILEVCQANGWVSPSVFMGRYNFLNRAVEDELFPCLREYAMRFHAIDALVGGVFAGGDTFERNKEGMYGDDKHMAALQLLEPVAERYGLSVRECALRWLANHSFMKEEKGDAMLIGASIAEHLESNLLDLEKGPLPKEVLETMDKGWGMMKGINSKYWF